MGGDDYLISTRTVDYDAFGTITFPNNTFNTIRVTSTYKTVEYINGTLTDSSISHDFNWITKTAGVFYANIDTSSIISGDVTLYGASLQLVQNNPNAVNENTSNVPKDFQLFQNYPNPFNPTTIISYQIPNSSFVTLDIYNALGQKVRSLINSEQAAGKHSVNWNGKDDSGNSVSSGIYLYRIKTGDFISSKKMVLLK